MQWGSKLKLLLKLLLINSRDQRVVGMNIQLSTEVPTSSLNMIFIKEDMSNREYSLGVIYFNARKQGWHNQLIFSGVDLNFLTRIFWILIFPKNILRSPGYFLRISYKCQIVLRMWLTILARKVNITHHVSSCLNELDGETFAIRMSNSGSHKILWDSWNLGVPELPKLTDCK